jgi:hypothetical protein
VPTILPPKDYTRIVNRHYTIARIKGGMKFTCTRCAHHVSTLDFDLRDGNLRTQAATAINLHATSAHHEPVMFSSLDAQQHILRS